MKHLALILTSLIALPALADAERTATPLSAAYKAECGSCHVAFPPGLLAAADWRKTMARLDRHFGTDASLDAKSRATIQAFLERHADRHLQPQAAAEPRLSATSWFRQEHREVPAKVWKDARVKSPANCVACHRGAEQGRYGENELDIPGMQRRHGREDD